MLLIKRTPCLEKSVRKGLRLKAFILYILLFNCITPCAPKQYIKIWTFGFEFLSSEM